MNKCLRTGFLIITLMLLFSSSSDAECTKDEIVKLINAGYNKTEISGLCEDKGGSENSAKPTPGETWTDPVSGIEFIYVPDGSFNMGSNLGENDEMPVHEVRMDGFWIGKYEVTQGQWERLMDINPSYFHSRDNHPVEKVSWFDVRKYISLLNDQTGREFSLPTEAQWEYAARSGGKDERMLGKNDADRIAWYEKNSRHVTHRVGSKAPNGLGIYDMSGNVWEWCEDVYNKNAYSTQSRTNPLIISGGASRVRRGGGFGHDDSTLRSANRSECSPGVVRSDLGFRLCLSRIAQ